MSELLSIAALSFFNCFWMWYLGIYQPRYLRERAKRETS